MKITHIKKIILIIYSIAITLWLYAIISTNVPYLAPNDFLGILSRLSPYVWISIILLLAGIKLTYDGSYSLLFYIGIILFIFILFGTYMIVEPHARIYSSYYPSAMANQIITNGQVDEETFSYAGNLYLYYSAFPIFTAIILQLSSIDMLLLLKYMPLFFIILISFVNLSSYKLALDAKGTITATCLFITSFWVGQIYFCPQLLSYLLLSFFLFLFVKFIFAHDYIRYQIISIIIFISMAMMHPLSPLMLCSFIVTMITVLYIISLIKPNFLYASNLARLRSRLRNHLCTMTIIYISLAIYIAYVFFNNSLNQLINIWRDSDALFYILVGSKVGGVSTWNLNRAIVSETLIFLELFCFILSSICLLHIIIRGDYRNEKILLFSSWFIGAFLLIAAVYGGEIIQRIYMFSLPAMAFLIAYEFGKNKILIYIIISLFVILHPIAFAGDEILKITPESELSGARFSSNAIPINGSIWYTHMPYVWYFNPYRAYEPRYVTHLWRASHISLNESLRKTNYIVYSELENAMFIYTLNFNLKNEFSNQVNDLYISKVYDNSMFSLNYKNDW